MWHSGTQTDAYFKILYNFLKHVSVISNMIKKNCTEIYVKSCPVFLRDWRLHRQNSKYKYFVTFTAEWLVCK